MYVKYVSVTMRGKITAINSNAKTVNPVPNNSTINCKDWMSNNYCKNTCKSYLIRFGSFHLFDVSIFDVWLRIDEFHGDDEADDNGINGYNLNIEA